MSGIAKSVIPLLSEWEKYSTENQNGDIPGFAKWVLANEKTTGPATPASPHYTNPVTPAKPIPATAEAGLLIDRLHRLLGAISKPTIKSLGFPNEMEFVVLAHVAILNKPNKKQLCQELLIEISTGVEITKRLAQKELITETPDPNDRRSALLDISGKGIEVLAKSYEWFSNLRVNFFEPLAEEETKLLVTLLSRLNEHNTARLNLNADLHD